MVPIRRSRGTRLRRGLIGHGIAGDSDQRVDPSLLEEGRKGRWKEFVEGCWRAGWKSFAREGANSTGWWKSSAREGANSTGSWWSDNKGDDCRQGRIEGEVANRSTVIGRLQGVNS